MNALRIARFLVTLAALLFAGLGLGFWLAPESSAHRFAVEAIGTLGLTTLRADLGGLFVGLALLCAAAAWSTSRAWFLAAAGVLAAVIVGRAIGWIAGGSSGGVLDLAIEVGALLALLAGARLATTRDGGAARRSAGAAWVLGSVLAVAALAAGAVLFSTGVQQWIFDQGAKRVAATVNAAPLADDALRVAVCGSSAPLPSAERAKACVAVFAGGKFWVVDTGPESTENLVLWGIPLSSIGGVLFTHFHSDHIGDLGELQLQTWAGGRPSRLAVYGGPGIEKVVDGFNLAYQLDQGYRTEHHGEKVMPSATWGMVAHPVELDGAPTPAKDRAALVLDEGGLRITAIEVDHAPIAPAYAYRFDYQGRSVVVSGDLKNHAPLATAAAGADVLVSEAIAPRMTRSLGSAARGAGRESTAAIMHDIEDYHITPEEAARIANQAGVQLLVFYHLLPAPDGFLLRRLFSQGVNDVRRGEWAIAEDGSLYTLPIGSKDVRIGRLSG